MSGEVDLSPPANGSRTGGSRSTAGERDRGAADALGLVLIAPAVIGLALLVIALGRRVDATAQVRSVAEAAAQAAALERSPTDADHAARRVVDEMLSDTVSCDRPIVEYPPPPKPGEVAAVRVSLHCSVTNRGVEVIDGQRPESVTAVATLDAFRARP